MKHTPGPWFWDSDEVKGDPLGRVRFRVVAQGKTITQTYYTNYSGGELTNAKDDARLIAAAPDLLFQLLAASNYIDALGGDSKSYRQHIAKATGEQQ